MLIKNGRINWLCLGADCPANCCGPTSGVLFGSKPETWEPLKPEIPENTVPAYGCKDMSKRGLIDYGHNACHIKQSNILGCHFLSKEGCTQYENRGYSCRSYPFFMDKYQGVCIDSSCPGVGAGWTNVEEIIPMMENLQKLLMRQFEVAFTLLEDAKK